MTCGIIQGQGHRLIRERCGATFGVRPHNVLWCQWGEGAIRHMSQEVRAKAGIWMSSDSEIDHSTKKKTNITNTVWQICSISRTSLGPMGRRRWQERKANFSLLANGMWFSEWPEAWSIHGRPVHYTHPAVIVALSYEIKTLDMGYVKPLSMPTNHLDIYKPS